MQNEKKIYTCECGKTFENKQAYCGHCGHCKAHLNEERYERNFKLLQERQVIANKARTDKLKKQSEDYMTQWISEQHTCEHCGKVMTEYYGSGRFCCESCAHAYANSCISEEARNHIIEIGIKNLVHDGKNLIEYWKTHERPKGCYYCGNLYKEMPIETRKKISDKLKGHATSIETRKKISETKKKNYAEGKASGWLTRHNQESYAEAFWRQVLENNQIPFKQEFKVNKSGPGCYFLDFLLPGNVDLEIDGHQHYEQSRKEHDQKRDEYLKSKGYVVYRIKYINPKNSLRVKEDIDKFLLWYSDIIKSL